MLDIWLCSHLLSSMLLICHALFHEQHVSVTLCVFVRSKIKLNFSILGIWRNLKHLFLTSGMEHWVHSVLKKYSTVLTLHKWSSKVARLMREKLIMVSWEHLNQTEKDTVLMLSMEIL